jgi:hypothetical protein
MHIPNEAVLGPQTNLMKRLPSRPQRSSPVENIGHDDVRVLDEDNKDVVVARTYDVPGVVLQRVVVRGGMMLEKCLARHLPPALQANRATSGSPIFDGSMHPGMQLHGAPLFRSGCKCIARTAYN